jgi:hypothetical protein
MPKQARRRLTTDELARLHDSADDMTLAIKGHLAIEALLDLAVSEALPVAHAVEVREMKFPLKVDLCVALGVLQSEFRGPLMKMNTIRNGFAHGSKEEVTKNDARDLANAWPQRTRDIAPEAFEVEDDPSGVLATSLIVAVTLLETRITVARDGKVRDEVLRRMVEEAVSPETRIRKPSPRDLEIEEAVAKARKERTSRGEL